jgi:hypothetical protein
MSDFPLAAFLGACLAIAAVVTAIKGFVPEELLTRRWLKSLMAVSNLFWGAMIAVPPLFPGESYGARLVWGLAAGGCWLTVYDAGIKAIRERLLR